ncbi:class I adenylate-forming enzyme family protein [Algihabitans albus]|uniref:class I adenylate-forming enzyme family protein n=1 Tax=Algihabitans albus TaxID=2164067 RepID=UPI000E5CA195|nr:class I adenylate-forming enzyme family protein [Algihabitans albus]
MTRIHEVLDRQAEAQGEAVAIIDADGTRFSYHSLKTASEDAARLLQSKGVMPGDRLLVLAENCAAAVAFIFAASRLGVWSLPVNARLAAPEVDRILAYATPRAAVLTVGVSPDAASHAERLKAQPRDGAFGSIALATPYPSAPEPEEDVAVMLLTTGTTGQPKGVMLTHDNLRFAGRASAELRGMQPGDIVYGVLPMTHVFGLASMIMAATHAGASIKLESRFSPEALHRALTEGVTILPAVPQMHALLMQYTHAQGHETLENGALRYVSSGAAPLDPVWKRKAEAFYGIPLQNGYGMTESTAGVCATVNAIGDPDISVGRPLPGIEIRIDETAAGGGKGVGEVLTRGPHVMKGYYRNPEETARILDADGWLHTGDLGRLDGEDRLHIVGRAKELIIRGGFNVYPQEVEAALNDHPAVVQAAVIGRNLEGGDEEVLAFVQISAPGRVDEAGLKAHVAKLLSGYKRPERIVVAEKLPAAATGKILKHKLISTFERELRAEEESETPPGSGR